MHHYCIFALLHIMIHWNDPLLAMPEWYIYTGTSLHTCILLAGRTTLIPYIPVLLACWYRYLCTCLLIYAYTTPPIAYCTHLINHHVYISSPRECFHLKKRDNLLIGGYLLGHARFHRLLSQFHEPDKISWYRMPTLLIELESRRLRWWTVPNLWSYTLLTALIHK